MLDFKENRLLHYDEKREILKNALLLYFPYFKKKKSFSNI